MQTFTRSDLPGTTFEPETGRPQLPSRTFEPNEPFQPKPAPKYSGAVADMQKLRAERQEAARHNLLRLAVTIGSGRHVAPDTMLTILDSSGADEADLSKLVESYKSWQSAKHAAADMPRVASQHAKADRRLKEALARQNDLEAELQRARDEVSAALSAANSASWCASTDIFGSPDKPEYQQFVGVEPLDVSALTAS